jgi:hypothetical protein
LLAAKLAASRDAGRKKSEASGCSSLRQIRHQGLCLAYLKLVAGRFFPNPIEEMSNFSRLFCRKDCAIRVPVIKILILRVRAIRTR